MAEERTLIVGLGNPGTEYVGTRHNIGFGALDAFASRLGVSVTTKKFNGLMGQGPFGAQSLVLLKPQTYMNVSGDAAQPCAAFYRVPVERVIVLHDELDLAPGTLRLKRGGGHGGHNGLRHLIQRFGSPEFLRLRLGIGRPERGDVTPYVLGRFGAAERGTIDDLIERACDALEVLLDHGLEEAQQRYHSR